VTLQGHPLQSGSILFEPLDHQGTQSGCGIENGHYEIPYKRGLKVGKYLIRITAGDGKTPVVNQAEAGGPGGNTNIVSFDTIPEEWNTKSIYQVEVRSGLNTFNFDIPNVAKPKPAAKKGKGASPPAAPPRK
jgi:hypothetical protein